MIIIIIMYYESIFLLHAWFCMIIITEFVQCHEYVHRFNKKNLYNSEVYLGTDVCKPICVRYIEECVTWWRYSS